MQRDGATVPCTCRPTTRLGSTLTLAMSVAQKSVHSPSVWPPFISQMKRYVYGKFYLFIPGPSQHFSITHRITGKPGDKAIGGGGVWGSHDILGGNNG
jgi:hypothetical protein